MKIINTFFFITLTTLCGCAAPVQRLDAITTFDATQAKSLLVEGNNTIRGSALIRQNNGGVVTCAGREINLTPATEYASERINAFYGTTERGFNSAGYSGKKIEFNNEPPEYKTLTRKTMCDAQGYFKFDKVATGSFYITAVIVWRVNNYNIEGGAIMQRVSLVGGEIKDVVLAP